jgi:hypothetical protein
MVYVTRHGVGKVTSDLGGIDCGAICEGAYGEGERVTLTPIPDPGYVFLGWRGCPATSEDGRCVILTLGTDCIEATFTGDGSTPTPWACGGTQGPGVPIADPNAGPIDHPPLGTRCTILGSPGRDVIQGTPGIDVICGGGGNDRIYGGAGHDLILGGKGNDRLNGGAGREHIRGGPGEDALIGGGGDDELFGEAGADLLLARDGVADLVNGGRGRDRARVDRVDVLRGVERRT